MMVARIEANLGPQGVKVTSPDHIKDVVTGEFREVDASLRYQVGSAQILIIIECRDRKTVQDVMWLDQLNTKKNDINANKCIAVAKKGFSKAAAKKAKHYGIDIRLVQEVTNEEIKTWFDDLHLDVLYQSISIVGILIRPKSGEIVGVEMANDLESAFKSDPLNAHVFFDKENTVHTLQSITNDLMKSRLLEDRHIPIGQTYRKELDVPPNRFFTRTKNGAFDITLVRIYLDIINHEQRVLLKDHLQYSDGHNPIAYLAKGAFSIQGHDCCTFFVQRKSDDSTMPRILRETGDTPFFGPGKSSKIAPS